MGTLTTRLIGLLCNPHHIHVILLKPKNIYMVLLISKKLSYMVPKPHA